MILPPGRHEPPRCWPIPVRALEGATSYWAGIVANASGHMSHHGAHGTEWTLVAPNELARLASLHPVATRRLPRVQANGVVFRARDLLVRQRTQCINALRGHLSEYGCVFPQGITHADAVIAHVEDPDSSAPESARAVLKVLIGTFQALEAQIQALDAEITQRAKADPVARRLMTIPGIGPIAATAITALVPAPEGFRAGRDFAAWLGLTPLQKSTGGKQKLGAISKMGERTIRRLLILG